MKKFLALLLVLFSICSCKEKVIEPVFPYGIDFYPRNCDYLHILNNNDDTTEMNLYVTSVPADNNRPKPWTSHYRSASDTKIEEQIRNFITTGFIKGEIEKPAPNSFMYDIDYCKEICKSLKIYADKNIFNNTIETDISDHFEFVESFYQPWGDFIFTANRELIGRIQDHSTIQEYLDHKPLMFSIATIRLADIPANTPVTTTFTVEIEFESGKVLQATTKPVTINDR